MTIVYDIEIHSYWHCGSGLSRGADTDALVIKDHRNLPYIPGKTVKGLVKEAFIDYVGLSKENPQQQIKTIFGSAECRSEVFFSDATLSKAEQEWITANNYSAALYKILARTAIDSMGIAKDHSLRSTEVVVPCVLTGEIENVPEDVCEMLVKSMGMIKNLGVNRNRGLGRCTFVVKEGGKE